MRGCPAQNVLHSCGSILGLATGSAKTYALSHPVRCIDEFISHNWSVKRWIKFLLLAYHFNRHQAAAITFVLAAIGAGLTYADVLPTVNINELETGVLGAFALAPSFLLALLFVHELKWLTGFTNYTTFLDKTCIHQTDRQLQRAGIVKLGAFLGLSRRIVVCYTDVYLRKLWTVYEMACFLIMHSVSDITLLDTTWIKFWLLGVILFYLEFLIFYINPLIFSADDMVGAIEGGMLIGFLFRVFIFSGFIVTIRVALRALKLARERATQFDVKDAMCFCEDDRPLVEGNISLLLQYANLIPKDRIADFLKLYRRIGHPAPCK